MPERLFTDRTIKILELVDAADTQYDLEAKLAKAICDALEVSPEEYYNLALKRVGETIHKVVDEALAERQNLAQKGPSLPSTSVVGGKALKVEVTRQDGIKEVMPWKQFQALPTYAKSNYVSYK